LKLLKLLHNNQTNCFKSQYSTIPKSTKDVTSVSTNYIFIFKLWNRSNIDAQERVYYFLFVKWDKDKIVWLIFTVSKSYFACLPHNIRAEIRKKKNEYLRCTRFVTFNFIDVTKRIRVTIRRRVCNINSIVFKWNYECSNIRILYFISSVKLLLILM